MRAVVTDRAIGLAQQRDGGQLVSLATQTLNEHGHFLAERRRRGRLAVRARQHRLFGEPLCAGPDQPDQVVDGRQQHVAARVANIMPWARLFMSSDVQAKWMNSFIAASSGWWPIFSFRKYSTALTS